ncbi:UNVERIFIED_CONTAM: hypothetical protein FKN15_052063 [Acipenser sinensis]
MFPAFLEEVQFSWHRLALAPSVSKQAAASLKGAGALGLVEFPPVDFTIVALVRAPPVGGVRLPRASPGPKPGRPYSGAQTALAVPGKGPGYRQVCLAGRAYLPWLYLQASNGGDPSSRQVASTHCPLWFSLYRCGGPLGIDGLAHELPWTCIPANTSTLGLPRRGPEREGDRSPCGPKMALENLVFRPLPAAARPALGDPATPGSPQSDKRHSLPLRNGQTPTVGHPP